MDYKKTMEYLSILLDMEKNIYIQEKTIENLYAERNSLGIKNRIELPIPESASTDYFDYMVTTGFVFWIIGLIIIIIAKWKDFWESSGIFAIIIVPIIAGIIALFIGLAGALIIGPFVAAHYKSKEQNNLDAQYKYQLDEYNKLCDAEEKRIKNENVIRAKIQQEITILENKYNESKKILDEFYNYNIISENYWHNIIAISSFYQYFLEKRTYSLEFNPKNGDKGAYNIYREEAQRGVIIIQLSKVLDKLDQIVENQEQIQNTMYEANKKISYLSDDMRYMSKEINSSINEQTAIESYNAERTQAELEFMNTMNAIYSWH